MPNVQKSLIENKARSGMKPSALPLQPEKIPEALRSILAWVTWKYVEEIDPETGEVDYDKPPRNARTDALASSTDPATWSPYHVALDAYQQSKGRLDGIGFVLHTEPGEVDSIVGIDLDKCRNPETGDIDPWAVEVIEEIASYTEVSPSGRGIRIFCRGDLAPVGARRGASRCTRRPATSR